MRSRGSSSPAPHTQTAPPGTPIRHPIPQGERGFRGDEKLGADILASALETPLRQIAENAGHDGSVTAAEALEKKATWGFNVIHGEWGDMFKMGILDPTKVVRTALQNAGSIAGLMLTTDSLVTTIKEKKKAVEGAIH